MCDAAGPYNFLNYRDGAGKVGQVFYYDGGTISLAYGYEGTSGMREGDDIWDDFCGDPNSWSDCQCMVPLKSGASPVRDCMDPNYNGLPAHYYNGELICDCPSDGGGGGEDPGTGDDDGGGPCAGNPCDPACTGPLPPGVEVFLDGEACGGGGEDSPTTQPGGRKPDDAAEPASQPAPYPKCRAYLCDQARKRSGKQALGTTLCEKGHPCFCKWDDLIDGNRQDLKLHPSVTNLLKRCVTEHEQEHGKQLRVYCAQNNDPFPPRTAIPGNDHGECDAYGREMSCLGSGAKDYCDKTANPERCKKGIRVWLGGRLETCKEFCDPATCEANHARAMKLLEGA